MGHLFRIERRPRQTFWPKNSEGDGYISRCSLFTHTRETPCGGLLNFSQPFKQTFLQSCDNAVYVTDLMTRFYVPMSWNRALKDATVEGIITLSTLCPRKHRRTLSSRAVRPPHNTVGSVGVIAERVADDAFSDMLCLPRSAHEFFPKPQT